VSYVDNPLVREVIGRAIEVHRTLGPGLLESAYQRCLVWELSRTNRRFDVEVFQPVRYKGVDIDCSYRLDLVVEDELLVEVKSVERLLPVHYAQVLTYLRLSRLRQGLLINFNVTLLKDGIKSILGPIRHEDGLIHAVDATQAASLAAGVS
jgi:GxxExxY protein